MSKHALVDKLLDAVLQLSGNPDLIRMLLETVQLLVSDEKKSAVAVLGELKTALHHAGMPCIWPIKGWARPENTQFRPMPYDNGMTVREANGNSLVWTIGIDGASAGVKFIAYRHSERKERKRERIVLHKPENAEVLVSRIQDVFSGMGFTVLDVIPSEYTASDNYLVVYTITTQWPSFLSKE